MPAREMVHEVDPRAALWAQIGDIGDIEVFQNQVLVAVYVRPERTKSGIILTQTNRDEDRSQGKVGLVLKLGPFAFAIDPDKDQWFGDLRRGGPEEVKVGDWVYFWASDGRAIQVNQQLCRIVEDTRIRGRVQHPDQVW